MNNVEETHGNNIITGDSNEACREQSNNKTKILKPRYICTECDYSTSSTNLFKNHLNNKHTSNSEEEEGENFPCPFCDFKGEGRETLQLHLKSTHNIYHEAIPQSIESAAHIAIKTNYRWKCQFFDPKEKILRKHLQDVHRNKPILKCNECGFLTRNQKLLGTHYLNYHVKDYWKKLVCKYCGAMLKTNRSLTSHIVNKHTFNGIKYTCSQCIFSTRYKCTYKAHLNTKHMSKDQIYFKRSHKNETKQEDPLNDNNLIVKEELLIETLKIDPLDTQDQINDPMKGLDDLLDKIAEEFVCMNCNLNFETKYALEDHIEAAHSLNFLLKCGKCDFSTNNRAHFNSHQFTHKINKGTEQQKPLQDRLYKCKKCDYSTFFKHHLQCHIISRHRFDQFFECHDCGSKYKSKTMLWNHIQKLHLIKKNNGKIPEKSKDLKYLEQEVKKKFVCDQCDYSTQYKSYLKKHVALRHTPEDQIQFLSCEICGSKFKHKSLLRNHVNYMHSSQKRFKCPSCPYQTNYKRDFVAHSIKNCTSTTDNTKNKSKTDRRKRFKCPECGYTSAVSRNIDKHVILRHTPADQIQYCDCSICGSKFKHKSLLQNHVYNMHQGKKRFTCPLCPYRSNWKNDFITHIVTKHKDSLDADRELGELGENGKNKGAVVNKDHAVVDGSSNDGNNYIAVGGETGDYVTVDNFDTVSGKNCGKNRDKVTSGSHQTVSVTSYGSCKDKNSCEVLDHNVGDVTRRDCDGVADRTFRAVFSVDHEELQVESDRSDNAYTTNDINHDTANIKDLGEAHEKNEPNEPTTKNRGNVSSEIHCKEISENSKDQIFIKYEHNIVEYESEYENKETKFKEVRNGRGADQTRLENRTSGCKLKCPYCFLDLNSKDLLEEHVKVHFRIIKNDKSPNAQTYKCIECRYENYNQRNLKRHILNVHSIVRQEFNCPHCSFITHYNQALKMHIQKKHDFYICYHCNGKFNDKEVLTQHIKEHEKADKKVYKCDECPYENYKKLNVYKHRKYNHELRKNIFSCPQCSFWTYIKYSLQKHIKNIHTGKTKKGTSFVCNHCDSNFKTKKLLERHCKTHSMAKAKYNCKDCIYFTDNKQNYDYHIMSKHTPEGKIKYFRCDYCMFKNLRKYRLKLHLQKEHVCPKCPYVAKSEHYLKMHIQNNEHTNNEQNLISCTAPDCSFTTTDQMDFIDHLTTHNFQCRTCFSGFKSKSNLSSHLNSCQRGIVTEEVEVEIEDGDN